jgi:hypothetical protein
VGVDSGTGDNFNRYWYADDNPYKYTDPDGEESVGEMIDSAAAGCGAVSCAGWAVLNAAWQVLGAEPVSQVADKGADASTGDKAMAVIAVVTLGKGKDAAIIAKTLGKQGEKLAVKMTGHAVNQAIDRGVEPAHILDAIKNPLKVTETKVDHLGRPSQKLVGEKATVVVNPKNGKIVTVHPTSSKVVEKLKQQ